MTIRVPDPMNNSQSLLDLQRSQARLATYTAQLTSGQAIVNAGDDPSGTASILNFQASIDQNSQYMSQIDSATGFLQNTSSIATTVNTNVTQLMELAQEGMSGTQSATSQAAIANQVDSINTNMVNLANTQVQGKYIFAGSATTTQPFTAGASTDPVTGLPVAAGTVYNGNNTTVDVKVGASATTPTNMPGDTLFMGGPAATQQGTATDLFAVTQSLSTALKAGNTADIQTAYNDLKAISGNINGAITQLGAWESGIADLKTNLTSLNANLTTVQNSVQSVNYASVITQFTQATNAQEATLATMAKVNAKSLFDYLA